MKRFFFTIAALLVAAIVFAGSGGDNFNRSNVTPIDGSWAAAFWDGYINRIRSSAVSPGLCYAGGFESVNFFTGYVPTDNQTASIVTVSLETSYESNLGVVLRGANFGGDGNSGSYYGFSAVSNGGDKTSFIYLYESDVGYTTLDYENATTWASTDTLVAEANGQDLTLKNGAATLDAISDSTLSSGSAGILTWCRNGGNPTLVSGDDFTVADLAGAPPPAGTVLRRRPIWQ